MSETPWTDAREQLVSGPNAWSRFAIGAVDGASVRKLEAELNRYRSLAKELADNFVIPAPNCSCHLSAPCSDCVEFAGLRELIDSAKDTR